MRVISGTARGTRLVDLGDAEVRPTLDRVKESFFNQIGQNLEGKSFLDLFAGTGSMGIEALSRGAEKVIFVEKNPAAQLLITGNLEKCRMTSEDRITRWQLMKLDALNAISVLKEKGARFDIIYIDPPFADDLYEVSLTALADILENDGWVIVEHFHKTKLQESYGRLKSFKDRRLGDSCLSFFELKL
ncbi:MAG: 16S rRNA (guanine(966)-N(2))-methyltransferase RsmD [Nitrospina sp.]|jgi:16S rRNA (guanine(966)-N(2))-methyltransferase RsmD|nr:16S rRNA (guanine(966)-N(2))-methyltransferase RsmD [Nitrospina sp.]MBT6717322.1 16S rRNA (guanine(966)-N(2))-methyltransferase RsmD [Nitrospina sp.]